MALVVNLKSFDGLPGRADRIVKLTFREHSHESSILRNAKRFGYFGQKFQWPLGRGLRAEETLTVQLYNYNKYLTNKLVGTYSLIAQQLMKDGELSVHDPMVDFNNRMLETVVSLEVRYYSPDGKVGDWYDKSDFISPVANVPSTSDTAHGNNDSTSSIGDDYLDFNKIHLDEGLFPGEDTASQDALTIQQFDNRKDRHGFTEAELHVTRDFEVRITIIKGEAIAGLDVDPVVRVDVGDQMKYTAIKQSTNAPYYNEYMVFNFNETPATFFDKIITIAAYHAYNLPGRQMLRATNTVAGKKLIGKFICDIGTVYASPGHQFYHKWAPILDPADTGAGPKGYVKCDFVVCGQGAITQPPPGVTDDDTDDIEKNILVPPGVPLHRQRAAYKITVFRAEDLPRTDLGLLASVKKAVSNKEIAFIDPYIKVSFAGHVGKTSVLKSYNPEWKEVLVFTDMFPPLCNRIKVELCDSEITSDETVAAHFIELAQIMNPGSESAEGILPTFGPSWINLYGSPRGFKIGGGGDDEDINQGIGEASAFRGRLLLSLETTIIDGAAAGKATVKREKLLRSSGVMDNFPRRPFLLFGTLFEASLIDKQLEKKPVYFELSIGKFGNTLDAKAGTTVFEHSSDDSSQDDSDDGDSKQTAALLKKKKEEEHSICINHSTTEPQYIRPLDENYGYMPITQEKTCLFTVGLFEDFRKRLFHSNILTRMYESLNDGLFDVKEMINTGDPLAHRRLKGTLDTALKHCDEYLRMFPTLTTGAGAGKTNLDKHRMKECHKFIEHFRAASSTARNTTTVRSVRRKFLQIKQAARKINQLSKDPQHALPDVILWMICDKKRVAYHRFNVRDLIYSTEDLQCGAQCGKRQTVFLKKPGRKVQGEVNWTIQAKLDLYLWLGEYDGSKRDKPYLAQLPPGFTEQYKEEGAQSEPPIAVIYKNKYVFELRAYLYQARSLIASDNSGFSDPFARVIFGSYCKSTQIKKETLCPMWDETLIFEKINIFGIQEDLLRNPPPVTVEVFDYDVVGDPEFLGRCIVEPKIKLDDEAYDPVILEWHSLHRGTLAAGELLAGFELLEGDSSHLPEQPSTRFIKQGKIPTMVFDIPSVIRPPMMKFRLEILFRGVRELRKIQLLAVKQPKIFLDFAGRPVRGFSQTVETLQIKNAEVNSNFEEPVKYMDVYLPKDSMLWPPVTVRCIDYRSFGRTFFVGVGTIDSLSDFLLDSEEEEQQSAIIESPQLNVGAADQAMINEHDTDEDGSTVLNEQSVEESYAIRLVTRGGDSTVITIEAAANAVVTSVSVDIPDIIPLQPGVSAQQSADAAKTVKDKTAEPIGIEGVQGGDSNLVVVAKSTVAPSVKGHTLSAAVQAKSEQQRVADEKKAMQSYRELISDCDWWSKYYVTKEDVMKKPETEEKEEENRKRVSGDIDEDEDEESEDDYSDYDMIDYSHLDTKKLDQLGQEAKKKALEMMDEKDKKKEKKRQKLRRKKRMKEKLAKFKGALNKAFSKESDDVSEEEEEVLEDKSYIARIKVYRCELEQVPEFGGFENFFKTYILQYGKKSLDDEDDNEDRFSGYFKGNFCIYKLDDEENDSDNDNDSKEMFNLRALTDTKEMFNLGAITAKDDKPPTPELMLLKNLPTNKPIEVKVIVYVIRALDLHPLDFNGLADPYLVVRCGRKKVKDIENKVLNQLNPVFGRMFEFEIVLPMDSYLRVEIWDYDSLSADDMIGSTTIDLENRFFSPHRPRCGLQHQYEMYGYNAWRDPQLPTQILEKLCKEAKLEAPLYGPGVVTVAGQEFTASETILNEGGEEIQTREHMALEVLKNWENIPGGCKLVDEHIETRSLFCSERPGEQGRIEMWVDMFPKDQPMPSITLDISPRKPEQYELRCIVWNTDDVVMDDTNPLTGERSSDIYVKGYLRGPGEDMQHTDIHYRSLTGEGNFNWRFVFPFEYLKAEDKIVFYKKDSVFDVGEKEYKVPPMLTLQLWDADLISADDMLGSVSMDLNKILRPAKNPKFCTLGMLETKHKSATLNLLKNKKCKGWWPVTAVEKDEENGEDEERILLKGKIEVELQLVTAEEAERAPVGLGRSEPEPLAFPNRPDTSFAWFMNPFKTLYYVFWNNWKWKILKFFIILMLLVLLGLLLYTLPGAITNRILNL